MTLARAPAGSSIVAGSCASHQFKDSAKDNVVGTTAGLCCTDRAICSLTCNAGRIYKLNYASLRCAGKTCVAGDEGQCCMDDTTKCKGTTGIAAACGASSSQSWWKDASLDNTFADGAVATCCTDRVKCSTMAASTCGAGKKLNPAMTNQLCAGKTCGATDIATCCTHDATKCGGTMNVCSAADKYLPSSKMGTDGTTAGVCCLTKATCDASVCTAGMKLRSGTNYCATGTCTASDEAMCCMIDPTKCRAVNHLSCPKGHFRDPKKWNTIAPNSELSKELCCSAQASCSTMTACDNGMKTKHITTNLFCATDTCVASDNSVCCTPDHTKCLGSSVTCSGCQFKDSAKYGTAAGKWHNCCTVGKTCTGYSCSAGDKLRTDHAKRHCAGLTCADSDNSKCCEPDPAKCKGSSPACSDKQFKDTAKYGSVGSTAGVCCTDKAACKASICSAGMKLKSGTHYCAGKACVSGDEGMCCEADTAKCRGANVNCAATNTRGGMFKDPAKYGTVGTTAAACCTAYDCEAASPTCGSSMFKDSNKNSVFVTWNARTECVGNLFR